MTEKPASPKRSRRKRTSRKKDTELIKYDKARADEIASIPRSRRKGTGSGFSLWQSENKARTSSTGRGIKPRSLSDKELRSLADNSPTIRPCVDQITSEVACMPWKVFPRVREGKQYSEAKTHASEVEEFLRNPNVNQESLASIFMQVVRDLLILDRCTFYKAKDSQGRIAELWARDAADFKVHTDQFGVITKFTQQDPNDRRKNIETFTPDEIGHFVLHPSTDNPFYGHPIIETISNQAAGVMVVYRDVIRQWDEDEIPPGILVLGKIGEEALSRMKASFTKTRGVSMRYKLRVLDNLEGDLARWVDFRRSNRDQQLLEMVTRIETVVWRNFGLSPVDMGDIGQANRAESDTQYTATGSRMIVPLANLLAYYVNDQIISEFKYEDIVFGFLTKPRQLTGDKVQSVISLWRAGLLSRNEARAELGYDPIEGGDVYTVLLGNEVVPLGNDGIPEYRNSPSRRPPLLPPSDETPPEEESLPEETATMFDVTRKNPYALEEDEFGGI